MKKILVIHGPNLDLLGKREADIYGSDTLEDINDAVENVLAGQGLNAVFFQSNHEGDIVDQIRDTDAEGIIINPAAYTHTSVAIRDAIAAKAVPVVEVHLSNIYSREGFRHKSMVAPVATGQISGFGKQSYLLGARAVIDLIK